MKKNHLSYVNVSFKNNYPFLNGYGNKWTTDQHNLVERKKEGDNDGKKKKKKPIL